MLHSRARGSPNLGMLDSRPRVGVRGMLSRVRRSICGFRTIERPWMGCGIFRLSCHLRHFPAMPC